jgi:murein DD-endopeptidase MepM/ murein hydrolase activator NlpD
MAHGYLSPTDVRGQSDLLGDIASAIGSRIKKSSDMARTERAYAKKQAENSPDNADFKGPPRGFFFKRALGSSFGGDRIARTRGRFETDPPAGRDPTGTQASRFRGGFDYTDNSGGVASDSGSGPAGLLGGGGPSGILGGGGGGIAQRLIGAGSEAINPEILGGEITQYKGTKTNAAGFSTVNTTATEIKDLAGILNQIGQLIVQTSNSSITAIDGVQRVNVKVVESVQSLGQLQVSIAEKQLAQQRQLAAASENFQEKMIERQRIASEKSQFTEDDFSGATTAEKGYGFGGRLGALFGGGMNLLGDGLDFMSGRYMNRGVDKGRQRGARRRLARRRIGGARRGALSRMGGARKALTGAGAKAMNKGLQKTGVKIAGKGLAKGLGKAALKKIPGVGLIAGLGFGVERLLQGDLLGAGLELASGAASTVPGLGTAGSVGLDAVLAARDMGVTPFATGGIIDDPTMGLVGEKGREGVFPLEGAEGRKTFKMFGEGILEAQRINSKTYANLQAQGIGQYFDKKNGWERFVDAFVGGLGKVGEMLKGTPLGILSGLLNPNNNNNNNNTNLTPYAGPISGETFNPLAAPKREMANRSKNQHYLAPRPGGREHAGVDITDAYSLGNTVAPVVAYKTGKITEISETGGSPGGRISIDHGGGFVSKYLHHVPRSDLRVGDMVYGGQKIADLLQYYDANGTEMTHLHFEMYKDGNNIDPTQYLQDAKNNISAPMTDAKAKQEHEKLVPPHTPPVTPEPSTGNPQERLQSLETESNSIKKMRAALTPEALTKAGAGLREAHRIGRSSKSNEDLVIPGVGKMRYFDNGFIKKFTYFNLNGNEIDEKAFMQLIEKRDDELENKQVELLEKIGTAREELNISSASTQPEVLQASALVSANERQSQLQPAIVTMPIQESQQSNGSSQPIMASTMAGASGSQITPGWLLNSVLT